MPLKINGVALLKNFEVCLIKVYLFTQFIHVVPYGTDCSTLFKLSNKINILLSKIHKDLYT